MPKLYGYGRVSTLEQSHKISLENQKNILLEMGVPFENCYLEAVSGRSFKREKLEELLDKMEEGDILVCSSMDRLARSVMAFVKLLNYLQEKGCFIRLVSPPLQTDSIEGRFVCHMMIAFAEYEIDLRKKRVTMGIAKAKTDKTKYKGRLSKYTVNYKSRYIECIYKRIQKQL